MSGFPPLKDAFPFSNLWFLSLCFFMLFGGFIRGYFPIVVLFVYAAGCLYNSLDDKKAPQSVFFLLIVTLR
jgi:hypothetical protein